MEVGNLGEKSGLEDSVLLKVLELRMSVERDIRERSEKFTLWMAGLCFAASAALLVGGRTLGPRYTLYMILGAVGLGIGEIWNLLSLSVGFGRNRECMVRIETALGLYDSGAFLPREALYPQCFRAASMDSLWRRGLRHFVVLFVWVAIAVGVLVMAIAVRPVDSAENTNSSRSLQVEESHQRSTELGSED